MAVRNTSVSGIYAAREMVEDGAAHLKSAGFHDGDIAWLSPESAGQRDLAIAKRSKLPEAALLGAILGGIAGGLLGWAAYAGGLAIPGLAQPAAAGPAAAVLSGGAALGIIGMIVGGLAGFGIPEYEVRRHEGRVRHGGILVSVHCGSEDLVQRAKRVLRETGALRIASAREAKADFGIPSSAPPNVRSAGGGPAQAS